MLSCNMAVLKQTQTVSFFFTLILIHLRLTSINPLNLKYYPTAIMFPAPNR